ncbi:SulP family inorganic anion transporter [Acetobacteraceae bacterium]|nr:SulP family inorganic anion transporter [Acetobacteraceae bacterium]
MKNYFNSWCYGHPLREVGAGMVSTFALIPEVIAFSYISGVSPASALFATFAIAVVLAFIGGRPGMISGAAGSVALVAAPLAHQHGLDYLAYATLLAGFFQLLFGCLGGERLMRFISQDSVTGFANGLAILIFAAQMHHILKASMMGWGLIGAGLAIIYLLPRFFTSVPSPLVCIFLLTLGASLSGLAVPTIADLGDLPTTLPHFSFPSLPWDLQTLGIILPASLAMAAVGVLESLLTLEITDEKTHSLGHQGQEARALGVANMLSGLVGGIGGCGMIGQTVGNLRYGGKGRLSILVSGAFLLFLMLSLHHWVAQVPVAALVAIMVMVSISTFSWESLQKIKKPLSASFWVVLVTSTVVVLTQNLALGVLAGVVLSRVCQKVA